MLSWQRGTAARGRRRLAAGLGAWPLSTLVVAILAITPSATPSRAKAARPGTWSSSAGSPNTWSSAGSMRDARDSHTATLLPDGHVLVAGGYGYNGSYSTQWGDPLARAELYNPRTGTWTQTSPMNDARAGHAAALLPNGSVLVVGGDGGVFPSSAEFYNPRPGRWQLTAPLHASCLRCTATTLPNGRVLVVGEATGSGAELYNPRTGTWTRTSPMITRRAGHTATLLSNGTVLVAGGHNANTGGILDRAEIYNPRTGRWSATGNMLAEREDHTAALLTNGQVLVAGGKTLWFVGCDCSGYLASAELYNPTSGTWTATGSMGTARTLQTATLLNTGQVLVAGGWTPNAPGSQGSLASAELYDPRTGLWAFTAAMPGARANATATLLRNGRVLVVGGATTWNSGSLAKATLYTPGPSALINLGPRSVDAGNLPLRTHGPAHAITLSSVGLRALVVSRITVGGRNPADFTASHTCIGVTIPPGRTCTVRIRFTPTDVGYRYATVTIVDNAPDSPHSIPVYGIDYRAGPNTWALTGNMLWPLSGHTAVLLHTGHVLLLGGGSQDGPTCTAPAAQLYDLRTGRWAETGGSGPPCDPAVALLPDGQVLVAGGDDEFCGTHQDICPSLSSAGLNDPNTGAWTETGSMTTGRAGATAIVLRDGRVLVAGGMDGYGDDPGCGACTGGQPLASAELYNPRTGQWTRTGSMTMVRAGHTATLLRDGRVLVAGPGASAELYDPRHGTWTATGGMTTARSGYTTTLLPNGKVLVAGGQDSKGTDAELYDPRTGRWMATGNMTTARAGHTATLLPNGRVLVTGGSDSSGAAVSSTELYDPGTGRWRAAAPMLVARVGHTATLLPNGQVLVAGGDSRGTSEVYTP